MDGLTRDLGNVPIGLLSITHPHSDHILHGERIGA